MAPSQFPAFSITLLLAMKPSSASLILADVLNSPDYDDRQLGQIVRLFRAAALDYGTEGFHEGFALGQDEGYGEGHYDGYIEGFQDGEHLAHVREVFVGVWADDTELSDLGTTTRIVGVATTRERASAMAQAYRDKRDHGSIFTFGFKLAHDQTPDQAPTEAPIPGTQE
jgi:hypothetical protein